MGPCVLRRILAQKDVNEKFVMVLQIRFQHTVTRDIPWRPILLERVGVGTKSIESLEGVHNGNYITSSHGWFCIMEPFATP